MAWIRIIDEEEAAPTSEHRTLSRLYRGSVDPKHGAVDNILRIHSLRPESLEGHLRLDRSALHPRDPAGLSRRERELLGVAVSATERSSTPTRSRPTSPTPTGSPTGWGSTSSPGGGEEGCSVCREALRPSQTAEEPLVVIVVSNEEPDDEIPAEHTYGSVILRHPNRVDGL